MKGEWDPSEDPASMLPTVDDGKSLQTVCREAKIDIRIYGKGKLGDIRIHAQCIRLNFTI